MAKIVDTVERDGYTVFILDNGGCIEADCGHSVGSELGCHNRFDTRTLCRLFNAPECPLDDCEESDAFGFECSEDQKEGDYDWGVWESELLTRFKQLGWID